MSFWKTVLAGDGGGPNPAGGKDRLVHGLKIENRFAARAALLAAGFTASDVRKIFYENLHRYILEFI